MQIKLIIRVRTLLDDNEGPLAGREAAGIGRPLFGDGGVEVVWSLVDVGRKGDDAAGIRRVRLRSRRFPSAGARNGALQTPALATCPNLASIYLAFRLDHLAKMHIGPSCHRKDYRYA